LRNSAELGLTTSVFFARLVAIRRVGEGFRERIPAGVIPVYSVSLTVAGEVGRRNATHLELLPKTLTFTLSRQVLAILADRGLWKFWRLRHMLEREGTDPESSHLKIF
jgi:hypothetical protein